MSVHYNDDFKKEVVRAYMAGDKSTVQIAVQYNISKTQSANELRNTVKNAYIPPIPQ